MEQAQEKFEKFTSYARRMPFPASWILIHDLMQKLRATPQMIVPEDLWFHPSELAIIAKFIAVYGTEILLLNPEIVETLNSYKEVWELCEEELVTKEDAATPGLALLRLSYQQQPYFLPEEGIKNAIYRSRILFSLPEVASYLPRQTSLAIPFLDWLNGVLHLFELFKEHPYVDNQTFQKTFANNAFGAVLSDLSCTREEFRSLYNKNHLPIPFTPYEFNPLLSKPVIRSGAEFWCAIPELLIHRATRGIYFELMAEKYFSAAFGRAFERYCKELLQKKVPGAEILTEADERREGYAGKNNDFTLFAQDKVFLFECKTSSLFGKAKKTADLDDVYADLKKNLLNDQDRSGLYQLSGKIEAVRNNRLPESLARKYQGKQLFSIFLLYDQMQFANSATVLGNILTKELRAHGCETFPFQIWSVDDYENLIKYVPPNQIAQVIERKFTPGKIYEQDLNTFLSSLVGKSHLLPALFVPRGNGRFHKLISEHGDHVRFPRHVDADSAEYK